METNTLSLSQLLCVVLCLSCFHNLASATHFRGSVIQWRTVGDMIPGSDITVEFTFRIGWRRSYSSLTGCDQDTIDNTLLVGIGGDLLCRTGCDDISSVTTLNYYCTDFSESEDWTVGERSFQIDIPPVPIFEASYTGGDWIPLVQGGGDWEVRVKLNIAHILGVGRLQNASPQTKMSPVLRLQHGCNHTVIIPVEDSDGDDIRCRWAESSLSECSGVCKSFPAELDERECTIKYPADGRTGYYAVALQIEDFATSSDTVAMSSVPLQFLVYIYTSEESCYSKPDFDIFTEEDGACIGVPPNATYHHQITALAGGRDIEIKDISTQSPPGMIKSQLEKASTSLGWYVNMTWTPSSAQAGPNIFCFLATDSTERSSDQRCMTVLGGVYPPEVIQDSVSPIGKIYPDNGIWRVSFDRPIYRPTRTAYIRFYKAEREEEVIRIDASTSSEVTFSDPDVSYDITIATGNINLKEKQEYFIRLDDGIVAGHEFCGPENSRVWSSSFWTLTIRDVTPPQLTFTYPESITSGNVTFSWEYDEEASSVCILQGSSSTVPVTCNNDTLDLYDMEEGYHTLYIQASDEEDNSKQYKHQWYADLTEPVVYMTGKPDTYSRSSDVTFTFSCQDFSSCSFMCKLDAETVNACPRSHRIRNLQEGLHNMSVYSIDQVANIGNTITYQWYVDQQSPVITLIDDVTVTCGDIITPTALGFPTVTDDRDPNPGVTYFDVATDQCRTLREWTAEDKAGNKGVFTQVISFSNPSPPTVTGNNQLFIACGSTDNIFDDEYILDHGLLQVSHPCERDLDISFTDSAPIDGCGIEITRTWTVRDDCGGVTDFAQDIAILKQSDPEEPEDGQINVPLNQNLRWPPYPGAESYVVYIWVFGEEEPTHSNTTTTSRIFSPSDLYHPNTQFLWKVGYIVLTGNTTREIPSPVWGMTTLAFADLALIEIIAPTNAFSGNPITIQYRVENVGNVSTSVSSRYWLDEIYMGPTRDFQDAKSVKRVRQDRLVDPLDGFLAETELDLKDSDIGTFYIFIKVDYRGYVDDFSEENNFKTTITPIKVQLTPPPNLIVDTIFTLGTAFSGQKTTISWKVKNIGLGITKASSWYDAVYILGDHESDTLLAKKRHTGELISNSEFDASAEVTMPNAIYGTYVIYVVTDVTNIIYEHTDEEDNRASVELDVILSPTPDFHINDLTVSMETANTGDVIQINYTVTNQGGGRPFERWWIDELTVKSVSTGLLFHKDTTSRSLTMSPGDTYNHSFIYRILQTVTTGQYNFTVHVDNQNRVFEYEGDDNNDGHQVITITQALPDLMVDEGTVTIDETPEATYMEYNISVTNSGSGYIFGSSWLDTIYLSKGAISSSTTIPPIHHKRHSIQVDAGNGYSFTGLSVLIPQSLYGECNVYVATDYGNEVNEESEANNFKLISTINVPERHSDLVIEGGSAQATELTAGDIVSVNWEVKNDGNLATSKIWNNYIYLSTGIKVDNSGVALAHIERDEELIAGDVISLDVNITVPLNSVGFYNLIITTVDHLTTHGGNFAIGVRIVSPPSPNLKVDDVQYTLLEEGRRGLAVIVDVKNHGNSAKSQITWYDRVMLQERALEGTPNIVARTEMPLTLGLLSQGVYTVTHLLVIPAYVQGYYDLVVEVDYLNDVKELFGERDNVWISKTVVNVPAAPYPNLQVAVPSFVLPQFIYTGEKMNIEYTIRNSEGSDISVMSLTNGVYIYHQSGASRREVFGSATLMGTAIINSNIEVGDSLTLAISASIPQGLDGDYYVYIVPDIREALRIPAGTVAYHIPTPIRIEAGPLPDLNVTLDLPGLDELQSGQAYTVTLTVENQGNSSATGTWYDTIILSKDPLIDPFDVKLKTTLRKNDLSMGNTYQQNMEIFIPFDLTSPGYYIIATTNTDSNMFESVYSNNFDHAIVKVVNAPAVDILTKDVTHSIASANYLEDITFTWTLENNGSQVFSGYKCDTVYLSPDEQWDIDDIAVSGPTCQTFKLQEDTSQGSSKAYSEKTVVPQVAEGSYTTIVRTRNNARDLNLENNIGASVSSFDITPPTMIIGQIESVSINENSDLVIKITEIPIGIALLVTLETTNPSAYHEMYLKAAIPPRPFDYDAISKERQTLAQQVHVPYTKSSNYYLLVESLSPTSIKYNVNLLAIEATFSLNTIYPQHISSTGKSTIRFNGILYGYNLQACMAYTHDVSTTLCAVKMDRINSEVVYATFDLSVSPPLGKYDVQLIDSGKNETVVLQDTLEVIQDIGGKLELDLVVPPPLRAGDSGLISCHVRNVGYNDIKNPLLVIASSGNSLLYLIGSDPNNEPQTNLEFIPMVEDEPGYILPPRTTRTFKFRATPVEGFIGEERITIGQVTTRQLYQIINEAEINGRPSNIPYGVWLLVFSNFLYCLSAHNDGLAGLLRERGTLLNKYSPVIQSIPDISTNLLTLADGKPTNAKIFSFIDISDKVSPAVSPLMIERVYPGSISQRRTKGMFGYGWTSPLLEFELKFKESSKILLIHERREYIFVRIADGSYQSTSFESANIMYDGQGYHLLMRDKVLKFEAVTGRMLEVSNSDADETITFMYDDKLPVILKHSLGYSLTLEHGEHGIIKARLLDEYDIVKVEVGYAYDTDGYLTNYILGDRYTSYVYNPFGNLADVIYPTGDKHIVEYDFHYFIYGLKVVSPSGVTLSYQTFQQACDGSVTVTENPLGITSKFNFDINGNLLSHEPSLGPPLIYKSDPHSNTVKVMIGDDETSSEYHDLQTKTSFRRLSNGDELIIQLNDDDSIKSVSDSLSSIVVNTYDNGLLKTITYADSSSLVFSYNSNTNVELMTLEDGSTIQFEYDPNGKMIRQQTSRANLEFTYNENKQLAGIINEDGLTQIDHNSDGLPSVITYPNGNEIQYRYNKFQQRTRVSTNLGYAINYFYDSHRRLSYVTNKENKELVRFVYDQFGRLLKKTLGNDMYETYIYHDNTARLSELKHFNSTGTELSFYRYSYDHKGYRVSMTTNEARYEYKYDASGQLIHWESDTGEFEGFVYDNRQNRITSTSSAGTTAYKTNILSQYTELGEYISFGYDKLGNLIHRSEKRGRGTTEEKYSFDQNKRLIRTESSGVRCEYKYTVFGAMSSTICTDGHEEHYLVDPFGVYGPSVLVSTENGVDNMIYYALEYGLIGTVSDHSFEYFLFDSDGSSTSIASHEEHIISSYRYDPFGNPLPGSSVDNNVHVFMGKYGARRLSHVNSALYGMGARVYDANIGRFMSKDPLGASGSPANSYTYANNNPLSYHDPHGLALVPIIFGGIVIGAITGAVANAIGQGINIYYNGGSVSDISLGDLAGATLSGAITGAAITTGAALPAAFGGGALATTAGYLLPGIGGSVGGYLGSATSNAIDGRPFDGGEALNAAISNGILAYLPWKLLGYNAKGAAGFGSPHIRMRFRTALNPNKATGRTIWKSLGLGNLIGSIVAFIMWILSRDPNDILGPLGYGDSNFIPPGLLMEYKIRFENDANATAPAQRVIIKAPLDDDLDITTFRLGGFGFGDLVIDLDYNSPFHQQMVNDSKQSGTFVYFQAGYDVINKEATWLFQTIDEETGATPSDPRIGFLPPNNVSSGEGYVTFSMQHKLDIFHMNQIDATASIIFDENAPIETPPIFHTIDMVTPNASIESSGVSGNGGLLVDVRHSDLGSGVRSVDIYSVNDTGVLIPLLLGSNETSVLLPIAAGEVHTLAVSAVDQVGNVHSLSDVEYTIISFTLNCPGNCSQQGECGGNGLCQCFQGYRGQNCSQQGGDVEPPVLDFTADEEVLEDTGVKAYFSARHSEDGNTTLTIVVLELEPPSTHLDAGHKSGAVYFLAAADFGNVKFTPPSDFSGLVNFTVEAQTEYDGDIISRDLSVSIVVHAVADLPTLEVQTDCFNQNSGLRIVVNAELTDLDGSESLTVRMDNDTLDVGENVLSVPDDIDEYTFNITAESKELSNGDTAETHQEVTAVRCVPTTTTSKSTTLSPSSTKSTTPNPKPTPKPTTAGASMTSSGITVLICFLLIKKLIASH